MFQMPFYNCGHGPTVVDTPLGRLGVNICFNAPIPVTFRRPELYSLDTDLLRAVDQVVRETKQNRSALIRDALRQHLKTLSI